MITDDEVLRLFERADPALTGDAAPAIDAAGYLDTLRTRSSNGGYIDTEPTPTEPPTNRRWPSAVGAAAATVVIIAGGLVLAARDDDETGGATDPAPVTEGPETTPPPEATVFDVPLAENGLIAFVGSSAESTDDIYVVAPDGTGLRALTSTPDEGEIAPAWSPDGTRLAFLRNVRTGGGELAIIDPSTGVETFSADIPIIPNSDVIARVQWSPDGRRIALNVANMLHPLIIDLETNTWTEISWGLFLGWSPDGKWFVLQRGWGSRPEPMLLVPVVLLDDTTELVVDSNVLGVRPVPVRRNRPHPGPVSWLPDSSAVAFTVDDSTPTPDGLAPTWSRIDVVTIADGELRTVIADGAAPSWSPDGRRLAYLRTLEGGCPGDGRDEVWVAAADGTEARAVATSLIPPIWSPDGSLLIGAGHDGLFTVRPDGTGMTALTPNMRPGYDIISCEQPEPPDTAPDTPSFRDPVWQPIPPSADAG